MRDKTINAHKCEPSLTTLLNQVLHRMRFAVQLTNKRNPHYMLTSRPFSSVFSRFPYYTKRSKVMLAHNGFCIL